MTISGEGLSLIAYDEAEEQAFMGAERRQDVERIADTLFGELCGSDVEFDTTDGLVEFTHSNAAAHEKFFGTVRAKRSFPDWVNMRMYESGEPEIMWDFYFSVMNAVKSRVQESLDG